MSFNPSKCSVMKISNSKSPPDKAYTFCGETLKEVDSHPYLGVELDSKLRWNVHYNKTTAKANRVLGFLKRNLWHCSREIKENAYKTLVRPTLEYASSVWDPYRKGDVQSLEAIQRKAARFCLNNYKQRDSVTQMIEELKWETLEHRRKETRIQMMNKIINNEVGIKADSIIQLTKTTRANRRGSQKIYRPHVKKDVHRYSFIPRTITDWNQLGSKVGPRAATCISN
ncbi:uncharacterized protein [Amphiura filiformis]|uniref:uncharacterized protein n=1 Tax=Amphiura filiformis TaxID=82378 RepID=UPI003B215713